MASSRVSFDEARSLLLCGRPLSWEKHLGHKGGEVILDSTEKRRLFEFLLARSSSELDEPADDIFEGLIQTWTAEGDPKDVITGKASKAHTPQTWRLNRIKTKGFGGLNQFGGPPFEVAVDEQTWCIEGQNGSGKTSLTSAIIWAFTGQVIREHSGLTPASAERKSVYDSEGKGIGSWPPIAAYPLDAKDLGKDARVSVLLTFKNEDGDSAAVYRSILSRPDGSRRERVGMHPDIGCYTSLVESGIVMPNRLAHLGFGERSETLGGAVKMLTGLDFLESVGHGVAKIKHGNGRFLNYAKRSRIEEVKAEYLKWLDQANAHAAITGYNFAQYSKIDDKHIGDELEALRDLAESEAKARMSVLADVLSRSIDVAAEQGREKVRAAVERAKLAISSKPTELSRTFGALGALSKAEDAGQLSLLEKVIDEAIPVLENALGWNEKQSADDRLRLKAEASLWYVTGQDAHCPLCDSELVTAAQKALGDELRELKADANAATRKLADVCNELRTEIGSAIPQQVKEKRSLLSAEDIRQSLLNEIRDSFTNTPSFSVLEGARNLLEDSIKAEWGALPTFERLKRREANREEPESAQALRAEIHEIRKILALAKWWAENKQEYWNFWKDHIGQPGSDASGSTIPNSLLGRHLGEIERSITSAKPYDETARALKNVIERHAKWHQIHEHQSMREEISRALSPLADLGTFVNVATSRAISDLSEKISETLKRVHLHERLDYVDTAFVRESARKNAVHVHGSLKGNYKLDATLVANASWLRAILWAFIFSLREEIVLGLGFNPLPLVVMDDPQVTFDPRNKQMWAGYIVGLASSQELYGAQVILTTHETSFFKTLVQINLDYPGRHGRIVGVTDELGSAFVEDGTHVNRLWDAAKTYNDDANSRQFIAKLRVVLESMLKYILWGQGASVRDELLSPLVDRLKRLSDEGHQPFNQAPIRSLANQLAGERNRLKKIQDAHHREDLGFPDAADIYEKFWDPLSKKLHEAFYVVAEFRGFQGDFRQYSYNDNVIALPIVHKDALRKLHLINTGIAAAARTDGRAGDGLVTITEMDASPTFLKNHTVFRVLEQTLEPVVNVGDFVIIKDIHHIDNRSLVVAGYGGRLLARRYSELEGRQNRAVLTAQTIDPAGVADPMLVPAENVNARMIVGTLFSHGKTIPKRVGANEVSEVDDLADFEYLLKGARLFKVQGQSAEPIALNGQYLVTGRPISSQREMSQMDGRLVIAADTNGARYFKRIRIAGKALIILESLNPDGLNPSILASFDDTTDTQISSILPVNGVLFELP